ncbi:mRNA splicing protein [Saccharomycopsis crataegensis]|uniref:mRNA splicing protein n=1 Tax=Saccharomycopsis crataegensis TaxID=43959 RepID=A0AAV5QW09_9ASCO|nr:mRNA splicing protein [Saccharomycopsis crataegensis]
MSPKIDDVAACNGRSNDRKRTFDEFDTDSEENNKNRLPATKKTTSLPSEVIHFDSINKKLLDFDFEKVCSISLAIINVYCCLTCGRFFQGKSKNSFAYKHSVDNATHKLFINLQNGKVFCLPENFEVDPQRKNDLLNDIRNLISPKYSKDQLQSQLYDPSNCVAFDLVNRNQYKIGFLGLSIINNNSRNNFQSVILQLIAHLPKIRDWYLIQTSANDGIDVFNNKDLKFSKNYELNIKLGLFMRKYWFDKLFKTQISPFDLLNYINKMSNGVFLNNNLDNNDPKFFLNWLLNNLNLGLKKSKQGNILVNNVQGKIEVEEVDEEKHSRKSTITKFWQLTLNLPDKKVLSSSGANDSTKIEQISLNQLLISKFKVPTIVNNSVYKNYKLKSLPNYLVLNFDRFNKNFRHNFNDIVIKYDIDSLDLTSYLPPEKTKDKKYEYKLIINIVHNSINSKNDESTIAPDSNSLFDANNHTWKAQMLDQITNEWYEIDNLQVKKINKRLIFLDESYVQVYQRVR